MRITDRIRAIRPSATLEVTARAIALRQEGVDIVSLAAGEPDFDTPEHIKQAAVDALARGETKYTPVGGTAALKEAIVAKMKRDNQLEYGVGEVVASCGGKHSLYNAFLSLFEPGDEVLLPQPCWVSYPDMLSLAGATPVMVAAPEARGFRMSAEDVRRAVTPRTRGLILNSPSNPTGSVYDESALREILEVVRENPEILLISDDVYERIVYDGRGLPPHPGNLAPDLRDRLIISNSVSKTYSMTGWRLGYTVGPAPVVQAITKLQGQSTSNPATVAQAAAIAALTGPQECVERMVGEFEKRRDFVVERLEKIPGVSVVRPGGAFYVFPNVASFVGRGWAKGEITNGTQLALYLLEEANVALVGGDDFGAPDHVRISYAISIERLGEALDRMERALRALV